LAAANCPIVEQSVARVRLAAANCPITTPAADRRTIHTFQAGESSDGQELGRADRAIHPCMTGKLSGDEKNGGEWAIDRRRIAQSGIWPRRVGSSRPQTAQSRGRTQRVGN